MKKARTAWKCWAMFRDGKPTCVYFNRKIAEQDKDDDKTIVPGFFAPQFAMLLDVTDFGAKGDGKTNDAPAFQAALNMASALWPSKKKKPIAKKRRVKR